MFDELRAMIPQEHILRFVKYNRRMTMEEWRRRYLSDESIIWLRDWTMYARRELPSKSVIDDLAKFRPSKEIEAWRYVDDPAKEPAKRLVSYFGSRYGAAEVAEMVGDGHGLSEAWVRLTFLRPSDILVMNEMIAGRDEKPGSLSKMIGIIANEVITYNTLYRPGTGKR